MVAAQHFFPTLRFVLFRLRLELNAICSPCHWLMADYIRFFLQFCRWLWSIIIHSAGKVMTNKVRICNKKIAFRLFGRRGDTPNSICVSQAISKLNVLINIDHQRKHIPTQPDNRCWRKKCSRSCLQLLYKYVPCNGDRRIAVRAAGLKKKTQVGKTLWLSMDDVRVYVNMDDRGKKRIHLPIPLTKGNPLGFSPS